jgi:hypothetical protein
VGTRGEVCLDRQKFARKDPGADPPRPPKTGKIDPVPLFNPLAMTKEGEIGDSLALAGDELVETAGTYSGGTYFGWVEAGVMNWWERLEPISYSWGGTY